MGSKSSKNGFWVSAFCDIELLHFEQKFLLTPIGGLAHGSGHARPSDQPTIYMSGNLSPHMSAELAPNILPNP